MDFSSLARPLALLLALTLGACSAPSPDVLRIGTNIWPGYEPLYLAQDLGFLNSNEIKLIEFTSATQVIRAFRNGALEAACLTLDEALQLAQDGHDIRIILIMDVSNGADAILARPPLASLTALKGRKLGVEMSALGGYLLHRALEINRIPENSVTIVPLQIDEHEQAYSERSIDAVVTFDPVRSKLLAQGARVVFDSTQLPGEIVDVMVVRHDHIKKHPQHLRQLVLAWFAALDQLHKEPAPSAQRMSARMGIDAQELLNSYQELKLPTQKENIAILSGNPPPLLMTMNKLQQFMLEKELLRRHINLKNLPDAQFIPLLE